jgi:hypothetical protein
MRMRGMAVVVAAVAVAAGCAPATDPSTSVSVSAGASASPVATVGVSETPSTEPSAASSPTPTATGLLLSSTGVGVLTIDLTADDISALTGNDYAEFLEPFAPDCGAFLVAETGAYAGVGALVDSEGTEGPVDTYSYNALSGYPDPGAFTADGLGVGSTLAQIEDVYGSALQRVDDLYMPDYQEVWVDDGSTGIMFYLDDADVAYGWNVGRVPQLQYVEGCA